MTDEELLKKMREAYNNYGSHPAYHHSVIDKVEKIWPVMGNLLKELKT